MVASWTRRLLPSSLVAILVLGAFPGGGGAAGDVAPELVADGLDIPVDLAFGPDGTLYFAELQTGRVRTLTPEGEPSAPVARVAASPGGNGGFLGLAADPGEPGVLYAYYSVAKPEAPGGKVNRVVRLEGGQETVLLDGIPWNSLHDGGRLLLAPDGFLYVTVGDADGKEVAQDARSLLGKVLRMTREGAAAPGNPENWHPLAFAKGFRNPFGIAAAPDGRVYVSDNGGQEEVNLLALGGNYGWPGCTGPCHDKAVTDPLASWNEHFGPTGIAVHGGTLYLADVAKGRVHTIDVATGAKDVLWTKAGARLLDVEIGPDECLYISGWEAVWRLPLTNRACTGAPSAPPAPPTAPPPAPAPAPAGPDVPPIAEGEGEVGLTAHAPDPASNDTESEGTKAPRAVPGPELVVAAGVVAVLAWTLRRRA